MTADGFPSMTAQRVAAYRLGFERLATPYGDPSADERLTRDVAASSAAQTNGSMHRYLQARTAFFDRVVINALEREVTQVVSIGAGYDGRTFRYAKPGVHWWEVDHPDTQADKRARVERLGLSAAETTFVSFDLRTPGLATALTANAYEPDAPSLVLCEGVAVYLEPGALERLFRELRSVATVGTRLAASWATSRSDGEGSQRRERFRATVAGWGEPAQNTLTAEDAADLLSQARWRLTDLSERAQRAGFVVAAPVWAPATGSDAPSVAGVARFMEQMLHRSGAGTLPAHLESTYGMPVVSARELDLGVHRIERADGSTWVARVFPAVRPIEGARQDAATLKWLIEGGFPAERCAHEEPVSVHNGQGVLVTQFVAGRNPAANPATFELLGQLLGQLHALQPRSTAALQPGGAWHHLVLDCGPEEEIAAATALLHDARHRVPPGQEARYDALVRAVGELDDCRELPKAFIHADPVPRNLIRSADGTVSVVDWAGAGWGPRVLSLGCLLWSAAHKGPASMRAAATGYRSVAGSLSPRELELLAGTMKTRPLILACWTFATGRGRLEDVTRHWQGESRAIEAGALLAAQVLSGDR